MLIFVWKSRSFSNLITNIVHAYIVDGVMSPVFPSNKGFYESCKCGMSPVASSERTTTGSTYYCTPF